MKNFQITLFALLLLLACQKDNKEVKSFKVFDKSSKLISEVHQKLRTCVESKRKKGCKKEEARMMKISSFIEEAEMDFYTCIGVGVEQEKCTEYYENKFNSLD